jgi:branched-chain amino acid transport system permease protein
VFFINILIHGLGWASIYTLIAVGFSLIFSASRIINLSQGEFVMLGGLMGFSLYSLGIPILAVPVIAALGVALVGIIMDRVAISPASGASPTSLIIITIALSIVLKSMAALIWGPYSFRIPDFFPNAVISISAISIDPQYLLVIVVCGISIVTLALFLKKTRLGRSIRACSMDPVGATLVGVSPQRMRMLSFCISGGLGGMIGTLITPILYASSDCGLSLGLKGFCAAVLGGMGSIPGAVTGGIIIGLAEAMGASVASSYKDVIAPLLMIIILYMRPQGILGGRS